jgi:hypothetical protein
VLTTVPLPAGAGAVADLAPVGGSRWLVLGRDGRVGRWDPWSGNYVDLIDSTVPDAGTLRLHADPGGRFAAVVQDRGRTGAVLDVDAGRVTMRLDGGDYHPHTVPFSLTFADHDGRTVVVHRTDWNRLDVSDAATGELLTARPTPEYPEDGPAPAHYLDYFHGRLHLSPDGRWLLDDGWVWHPLGVPAVWSLADWLGGNPYESEDGPSLAWAPMQDSWDVGMTWIDDGRFAVAWADGGVRVFDTTGTELIAIPGAGGRLFSDGRVLLAADDDGLTAWDPENGERLWAEPGFAPTHQHRPGAILLELAAGHARTWQGASGRDA